jgi:tRNA pseudouridine55 synthase
MNRIFVINKQIGLTSQNVVSKVKKILNEKKAGHTGTLDPMATGVLPVLVGSTTKLSKYLIEHEKKYLAVLKLGFLSSTGDSEGEFIEKQEVDNVLLKKENVISVFKSFIGEITQTPPIYSAIKVNGKKLYEYARKGEEVEIPKRNVKILEINLKEINLEEKEITFEVYCSKGTYIRTLCEDIAKKLGTIGYMKSLTRTEVNNFKIENAITLEDLEKHKEDNNWLEEHSYSMEEILSNLQKIELNNRKKELFLNGVMLSIYNLKEGIYNIYCENEYLGTGTIQKELLKRDIIL